MATPWGQIQQVRWELARLSERVNDKYESKAALAFAKDGNFKQPEAIATSIEDLYNKARVLSAIAHTYGTIGNSSQAEELLKQSLAAAGQIDDSGSKAWIVIYIAQTYGTIKNFPQAEQLLEKTLAAAGQIDDSGSKARVLSVIAQTYGTIGNSSQAEELLKQALAAAGQIDNSYGKAWVLSASAQTYGTIGNFPQAEQLFKQALAAAGQIDDSFNRARVSSASDYSYYKARVLSAIAEAIGTIGNFPQAEELLKQTLAAAGQIDDSDDKADVLSAIAQTQAKFAYWRQAHHTVSICPGDDCKVVSLAHILTAWAEKRNPALVDKEEDRFFSF